MEDPVLTTHEAARLLGVSVRTAQNWIENDILDAWKTPGGHRRVRESAVLELRDRLAKETTRECPRVSVLLLAGSESANRYQEALLKIKGVVVERTTDTLSSLIAVGRLLPAVVVVEVLAGAWDRGAMVGHLLNDPSLGHTSVLAVCDSVGRGYLQALDGHPRLRLVTCEGSSAVDDVAHLVAAQFLENSPAAESGGASELRYPLVGNEAARLSAVRRAGLVDTRYEPEFDEIAGLTARTLEAPICLISLLTQDRQWFKAHFGLDVRETPRAWAFCNYTIVDDFFTVHDAREDARFQRNPLVEGPPHIRFYAGAALRDVDGFALGSLCVIDRLPRVLDADGQNTLRLLAGLLTDRINLAIRTRQLHWRKADTMA
ncbi:histidine kinase [Trinickia dabaoshanensis]|uniref:Histidine kinase n=1 Tax=Trinickia dabaoshanensis TaxID=564714 RepID=A0A2N7VB43_9BURK|nr:helix-turn-helix domain-containing protein [Trinickia dabaoshanensis]PMS13966.1 histidine kinase [Trinickia dabaoshanensis]